MLSPGPCLAVPVQVLWLNSEIKNVIDDRENWTAYKTKKNVFNTCGDYFVLFIAFLQTTNAKHTVFKCWKKRNLHDMSALNFMWLSDLCPCCCFSADAHRSRAARVSACQRGRTAGIRLTTPAGMQTVVEKLVLPEPEPTCSQVITATANWASMPSFQSYIKTV